MLRLVINQHHKQNQILITRRSKNHEYIKSVQEASIRMFSSYQENEYPMNNRNRNNNNSTRNSQNNRNNNRNNNDNKYKNYKKRYNNNNTGTANTRNNDMTNTRQNDNYNRNNSNMDQSFTRNNNNRYNNNNSQYNSNNSRYNNNNNRYNSNNRYNNGQQQPRFPSNNTNTNDVNYNNDMESLKSIFLKSIEIDKDKPKQSPPPPKTKSDDNPKEVKENEKSVTEEKDDLTAILRSILLDSNNTPSRTAPTPSTPKPPIKSSWRKSSEESNRTYNNIRTHPLSHGQNMMQNKNKKSKTKQPKKQEKVIRNISIPNGAYWSIKQVGQELLIKASRVHKKLMQLDDGYKTKKISDIRLDADTIELIVEELGHTVTRIQSSSEDILKEKHIEEGPPRPPVICIMGHVDHGKTTLLDALRTKSNAKSKSVAPSEIGGITQIISAFQVNNITFLDTPGHAAFASMRKSSKAAMDILILVIDCKEGIQEQTNEIIDLYLNDMRESEGNQSLVVAMTKVDQIIDAGDEKEYNMQIIEEYQGTVENQLASSGIDVNDIQMIPISSKSGYGLDDLLDAIDIQSQLMDLRASPTNKKEFNPMDGIILEGRIEKGLGNVVDTVVRDGTIKVGSTVLCYNSGVYGKVKRLIDVNGKSVKQALPSQPVRIIGLKGIPQSGESVITVENEDKAKEILEKKMQEEEEEAAAKAAQVVRSKVVVEEEEEAESMYPIPIPIVVKADTHGSLSAVQDLISNIYSSIKKNQYSKELKNSNLFDIKLISSSIGSITSNDIQLANDSKANLYAFGTPTYIKSCTSGLSSYELNTCTENGLKIHQHSIIYKVIDELQNEIVDKLPKTENKVIHGKAIVQAVFHLNGANSVIAGLRILDGSFYKHVHPNKNKVLYQIKRKKNDKEYVVSENLSTLTLRKLKEDVESVKKNEECGIDLGVKEYEKEDVIECYSVEFKPMDIF